MAIWLMKSEPDFYGIKDLEAEGTTLWHSIRNYQARNFMRQMKPGEEAFFYHSNVKPPGIVGLMEVIDGGHVDPVQFDPDSRYFDPNSRREAPRWDCVRLRYRCTYAEMLSLPQLRQEFSPDDFRLLRPGNRLSILPVPEATAARLKELLQPRAQG